MGKFSTYRYLELKDDTSSPHINVRSRAIKQPRRLRKVFILLVVAVLFGTYFLGLFANQSRILDNIASTLGYKYEHHYAVIIDAGSSGSRVLAYKFRVPFTVFGAINLDLVEEYFEQSKPGLSSYADDPEKGAETIVQLVKKAEFLTPPEKRKSTPLIVRATAGLRLLPAEKADRLIHAVRDAINKLGYDTSKEAVEIMNGADEGIFIWYSVNLLHSLMGGETMAALDLGGGSTQITYQIEDAAEASRLHIPEGDLYVIPAGDSKITLYTHSYLKLGLLAARYEILKGAAEDNSTHFSSPCVDPIVENEKWVYANKEYFVSGAQRPAGQKRAAAYTACYQLVKQYVMKTLDWEPKYPPRGKVAAMSFFYDVAADAGIIDVITGGSVTIAEYKSHALTACSAANIEQPWACLDLVYMVALLQDAYKIGHEAPISLFKKVNGHEVSWALGLGYTNIMNSIAIK